MRKRAKYNFRFSCFGLYLESEIKMFFTEQPCTFFTNAYSDGMVEMRLAVNETFCEETI